MAIEFFVNHQYDYFVTKISALIDDSELFAAYKEFFASEEWIPGMSEIVDLSEAELKNVTPNGIMQLASFTEQVYKRNQVENVKVAVYFYDELPLKIARIYLSMCDESPENIKFFRVLIEAKIWLLESS